VLKKPFWSDDQNFSGLLMRSARGDMRDHIGRLNWWTVADAGTHRPQFVSAEATYLGSFKFARTSSMLKLAAFCLGGKSLNNQSRYRLSHHLVAHSDLPRRRVPWTATWLGMLLMALGLVSILGSSRTLREAVLLRG
jgi:hypothetical protein